MITDSGGDEMMDQCGGCVSRRGLMAAALAAGGAVVAGAAAPAAAGQSQWTTVANHGAIEVGNCRRVETREGQPYLVTRVRTDAYRAFTGICTHVGFPLYPRPAKIICSSGHGSEFDKRTGEVLQGPAQRDLREFRTRIRRGKVQILI